MPAPFPSSKNYAYTYGSEAFEDLTENEARSEVPSVAVAELKGHDEGPIHIVRFTADGKYCVTGGNDRTVRLWNPTRIDPAHTSHFRETSSTFTSARQNDKQQQQPSNQSKKLPPALPIQKYAEGHVHPIHALTLNSSSTVLLSASDKTLLATDLVTAQTKQKWWGHYGRIEHVACLGGNNEGSVASAGEDIYASASYDATVRLWDARSRSKEPLMILEDAKDAVTCVSSGNSALGDAQIITSSVDGKIRTYDLRKAQLQTEDLVHPITSFTFSNDASCIAASCLDGIIRLWDCTINNHSRKRVFQKMHSFHKSGNYKLECAFTSQDKYLVSGSECGAVVVYPVSDGNDAKNVNMMTTTTLARHNGPVCSVATCPKKNRPWLLVSASYDGSAVVWASKNEADHCLEV
eukprot:CAMPEP_0171331672 /NCGR_PEP_ID=MMETSP0878-20121228/2847_1 /TAXON_ID=67004 /ORGANISM="Thalassiosira weissflogii, Strain CCMP1336" /LENGTH=406 /DNA_ID=CAMNT_0011832249 /DNA_START=55 /DNA_END=1275 /DNA_ORIENTATION=+